MKTNAMVTIEREGKTIVIYVDNSDWSNLPDLSFIADVEVYQPERLNPEDSKYYYVCMEEDNCNCPYPWHTRFQTNSKQEAQDWVDIIPHKRTWHEHIRVCDSPTPDNK